MELQVFFVKTIFDEHFSKRQRTPEIVHSLKMSKESITTIYLPFQSKWLMVGTEKVWNFFYFLINFIFFCRGIFILLVWELLSYQHK